jgi:hypothetical protein
LTVQIEVAGVEVTVSEETMEAYLSYKEFVCRGIEWLREYDANTRRESALVQEFRRLLLEDVGNAVQCTNSMRHKALAALVSDNEDSFVDSAFESMGTALQQRFKCLHQCRF